MNESTIKQFVERVAKTKEDCIVEAMAAGIDLHNMAINEWFEQDGNIIRYHCKAMPITGLTA